MYYHDAFFLRPFRYDTYHVDTIIYILKSDNDNALLGTFYICVTDASSSYVQNLLKTQYTAYTMPKQVI